jgi:CheY-like chemotaxis protein
MSLKNKVILLVDDDKDFRTLSTKVLEGSGYSTLEAENVREGMHIALSSAPHLIILDLNMPGEDGFVFLEERLRNPGLKAIPVLVFSASKERSDVHRAMATGAANYIVKPLRSVLLLQKIRQIFAEADAVGISHVFKAKTKIMASVPAHIVKINEKEAIIGSAVKFRTQDPLRIESPLLNSLQCPGVVFKTVDQAPLNPGETGYNTKMKIIGLTDVQTENIRRYIRFWKNE